MFKKHIMFSNNQIPYNSYPNQNISKKLNRSTNGKEDSEEDLGDEEDASKEGGEEVKNQSSVTLVE